MANEISKQEAEGLVNDVVAYLVSEKKGDLVSILRKNGVDVSMDISNDDLIIATYSAFATSSSFKKDLFNLSKEAVAEESNYVDEDFFNLTSKEIQANRLKQRQARGGKTRVGSWLSTIFSSDNVQKGLELGFNSLNSKLTAKADQSSKDAIVEVESAKTQSALAEAEKAKAQGQSKKWVLPVVIGGIVLVGGIVAFFMLRKKK